MLMLYRQNLYIYYYIILLSPGRNFPDTSWHSECLLSYQVSVYLEFNQNGDFFLVVETMFASAHIGELNIIKKKLFSIEMP